MKDGLQFQVAEAAELHTLQYKPQTFSQLTVFSRSRIDINVHVLHMIIQSVFCLQS